MTQRNMAVDWWQVVVDLERCGYTLAAMAAAVGVASSTLKGWKNLGAEPGHSAGERLLGLWVLVTGRKTAEVPRMVAQLSAAELR